MPFGTFDNSNLVQMHWGTLDFTLNTCDSATLSYNSTMSIDGQPFGSGSIQLSRLSSVSGLKCTTNFLHGNVSIVLVDPTGEVGFGAGLLFGNGDVAMYALGTEGYGVLLGTWQQSGTEGFRIDATLFYADGGTEDVTATGTFGDDGFVGSYTGGGSVRATWLRSFQFDLTYQQLAGNYSIAHPTLGQIGSASVATNGHVTGNTIDGCVIVGDFVIPDTRFKQAYFEGDISNCASAGSIVGAAIYEHVQNTITVIGTDGFYGSFLILN
jgi:hypothetical protein